MPVLFVHGITVRQERFDSLLQSVRQGVKQVRPTTVVEGFYWGDLASSLRFGGASIPGFLEGRRAIAVAPDRMSDAGQLTALLLDDPLLELRVLCDAVDFDPAGAGFAPLPTNVAARNGGLEAVRPDLATDLAAAIDLKAGGGRDRPRATWPTLMREVLAAACKTDRTLDVPDLIDPITRALTAMAYRETSGEGVSLDTAFRWSETEARIQGLVEARLGGQRSWIGDKLKGLAAGGAAQGLTFAMRHGLRRRIMESTSIFVGDVLAYLASRDRIQAKLEQAVAELVAAHSDPLWLVGHSLGGILCFDHCLRTTRRVDRLVTVGSQVGLFAELGAFPGLVASNGGRLRSPARIASWMNVYDPDDILSFLAEPVLTGAVDDEFDTGAPFPVAHSEYWNREALYDRICR